MLLIDGNNKDNMIKTGKTESIVEKIYKISTKGKMRKGQKQTQKCTNKKGEKQKKQNRKTKQKKQDKKTKKKQKKKNKKCKDFVKTKGMF